MSTILNSVVIVEKSNTVLFCHVVLPENLNTALSHRAMSNVQRWAVAARKQAVTPERISSSLQGYILVLLIVVYYLGRKPEGFVLVGGCYMLSSYVLCVFSYPLIISAVLKK